MGLLSKYHEINLTENLCNLKLYKKNNESIVFNKDQINYVIKEKFDVPFVKNDFKIILKDERMLIVSNTNRKNWYNVKKFIKNNDFCIKSDKNLIKKDNQDYAYHYRIESKDIYFFRSSIVFEEAKENIFSYTLFNDVKIELGKYYSLFKDKIVENTKNVVVTEKNWNIASKIRKFLNHNSLPKYLFVV